jgi:hypothetical protein
VNERGGLNRETRWFVGEIAAGQIAEFVVDQREEVLGRGLAAVRGSVHQHGQVFGRRFHGDTSFA